MRPSFFTAALGTLSVFSGAESSMTDNPTNQGDVSSRFKGAPPMSTFEGDSTVPSQRTNLPLDGPQAPTIDISQNSKSQMSLAYSDLAGFLGDILKEHLKRSALNQQFMEGVPFSIREIGHMVYNRAKADLQQRPGFDEVTFKAGFDQWFETALKDPERSQSGRG